MGVPGAVGPCLVLVESGLVLRLLEALLDPPPRSGDGGEFSECGAAGPGTDVVSDLRRIPPSTGTRSTSTPASAATPPYPDTLASPDCTDTSVVPEASSVATLTRIGTSLDRQVAIEQTRAPSRSSSMAVISCWCHCHPTVGEEVGAKRSARPATWENVIISIIGT